MADIDIQSKVLNENIAHWPSVGSILPFEVQAPRFSLRQSASVKTIYRILMKAAGVPDAAPVGPLWCTVMIDSQPVNLRDMSCFRVLIVEFRELLFHLKPRRLTVAWLEEKRDPRETQSMLAWNSTFHFRSCEIKVQATHTPTAFIKLRSNRCLCLLWSTLWSNARSIVWLCSTYEPRHWLHKVITSTANHMNRKVHKYRRKKTDYGKTKLMRAGRCRISVRLH